MDRRWLYAAALLATVTACPSARADYSQLWGREGELWDPRGRLPDFSYAGYRAGRAPIPDVPRVVNVQDFGARGNGSHDDTGAIQRAIEAAGARGGGAVYFPRGRYRITDQLRIRHSGVVLRGASRNDAVLYVTRSLADLHGFDLSFANGDGGFVTVARRGDERAGRIAEPARRGDRSIVLDGDAERNGVRAGRYILIQMEGPRGDRSLWDHRHNDQNGSPGALCDDAYGELGFWIVRVRRVDGRRIDLDQPLRQDVRMRWSPTVHVVHPLTNIGVEDLGIEFERTAHPGHHLERGYNAIDFEPAPVIDGWIRNVRIRFADNGINLSRAKNITVRNVQIDGDRPGGYDGHHGTKGGIDCLWEDLEINANYIHEITFNERTTGTVYSRGRGAVRWSLDHHGRATIENLITDLRTSYDWLSGGGACSPQAGARNTYWRFDRAIDPPSWAEIQTNIVGRLPSGVGQRSTPNRQWFEVSGDVSPRNLFEAQRARRLAIEDRGRFAPGPAGLRNAWREDDRFRWAIVRDGDERRYWLATSVHQARDGGRLGEHSLLDTPVLGDATLSGRANSFEQLARTANADYALVLGWQNDRNYYFALYSAEAGEGGIFVVESGERRRLATARGARIDGGWHRVAFARRGATLEMSFDTEIVASIDDTTHGAGLAGVGTLNDSAMFDDLAIDSPDLPGGWGGSIPEGDVELAEMSDAASEADDPAWTLPDETRVDSDDADEEEIIAPFDADGGVYFDEHTGSDEVVLSSGCSVLPAANGTPLGWLALLALAALAMLRRLRRSRAPSRRSVAIAPLVALLSAGCVTDLPEQGSWVEVREAELAEDALLIEDHAAFVSVEREWDRLRFTLRGESPLRAGMVVAGNGDGFYLRRITRIEESGGELIAHTEAAHIDELYHRLSIVAHYRPRRSDAVPVTTYEGDVGMSRGSLTDCEDSAPCTVTGGEPAGNDTIGCSGSAGGGLSFEPYVTPDIDADVEFDVSPRFGLPPVEITSAVTVTGSIEAGVLVSGGAAAQLSCDADFAAALGGGEAPEVTLWAFAIGPIPARLVARPVAEGQLEAEADVGVFAAQAGVRVGVTSELGMRDNSILDPIPDVTLDTFAGVSTEQSGGLRASASLTIGMELALVAGGDITIPVIDEDVTAEIEAGLRLTGTLGVGFDTDDRGCNWSGSVDWSLDGSAFASFDFEVISEDQEFGPWTLASGTLGEFGGAFPWCGGSNGGECTVTGPSFGASSGCMDDVFDVAVCEGQSGYFRCGSGAAQRCTCSSGAWTDCSPCMAIPMP